MPAGDHGPQAARGKRGGSRDEEVLLRFVRFDARLTNVESAGVGADESSALAKQKAAAYVGQVVAARYRVEELLALGGMGAVFRAEHVHMRKEVALKLLHPSTENLPELVTRFERESVVGAHVSHPNVCQATDFGKLDDGSHYLVLEFVHGRTLHEVLKKDGPMDPTRAARIAIQIAAGLGAAHELGIVHRDVKPANVMVEDGPDAHVKIVDFGLAKLPPERFRIEEKLSITSTGTVFGTVAYMAPELARGMHAVDHRSDLYALGVVVYQMLAGKHPFEGEDSVEIFRHHCKTPVPPMSKRAPDRTVPPELEAVARKLLEKTPATRYQSAAEVVAALEEACPDAVPAAPAAHMVSGRHTSQILAPRDIGPPSDASPQPAVAPAPEKRGSRGGLWLVGIAALLAAGVYAARSGLIPGLAGVPVLGGLVHASSGPANAGAATTTTASAAAPASAAVTVDGGAPSTSASNAAASEAAVSAALLSPDAIRQRQIMIEAASVRDAKRGATAMLTLAKVAPDAFRNQEVVAEAAAVAVPAALDPTLASEVFGMLAGPTLGTGGPDVLFAMMTRYGGSRGAAHAAELLASPTVLAQASPGLRVARDFKLAPCRERPDLYDRAVAEGDERTLFFMSSMLAADCSDASGGCCAPRDARLSAATTKLRQRLHK
jgi:serine/threonine-protein kinase